jgi:hypothetical protein
VIALLSTTTRRISFAIALSLLVHALIFWLPQIELPRFSRLPTLTAHLEEIHHDIVVPKIKRKPKPKPKPAPPPPEPVAQAAEEIIPLPASAVVPESSVAAASAVVPESAPVVSAPEPLLAEKPANRPPLPRHAELRYAVYSGTSSFRIGESLHTLEMADGRYTLQAVTQTAGLVSLFKSYKVTQRSSGTVDAQGLHPEQYSEERVDRSGTLFTTADFNAVTQTATFSHGGVATISPDLQDILSMLYQFPPLPMGVEMVPVTIGNSKKIERYQFEIAYNEEIDTPLGSLHTVHFRKMHTLHEEGLELWIAQEYRFLPVKLRHIDRDGKVSAEVIITDIRVADE